MSDVAERLDQDQTNGKLTQNGLFARAVDDHKNKKLPPELVKVYEKILAGTWSLKGFFDLIDYKIVHDGNLKPFVIFCACRVVTTSIARTSKLCHSLTRD